MQCILTAMKAESDPLIEYFHLKKVQEFNFPVFSNADLFLIGIGIGKKNIKSRIKSFMHSIDNLDIQFINIGIAGGRKSISELGEIYYIHKIIDESSRKSFYPDILLKHFFNERVLTTVEREINDGGKGYDTLVDMEASEIFRICEKFVPIQNLFFLKIVSDHMNFDNGKPGFEKIKNFITPHIEIFEKYLVSCNNLRNLNSPILSIDEQNWIKGLAETLSLTKTQSLTITKIIKGYRLKNPNQSLPDINFSKPISKFDRNKRYKDICEKFII